VLRETTSRGLCGLVCPARTSQRRRDITLLPDCVSMFVTSLRSRPNRSQATVGGSGYDPLFDYSSYHIYSDYPSFCCSLFRISYH
jgi:hypothetical protein